MEPHSSLPAEPAAGRAEQAWRAGDTAVAIEAADEALAHGCDPDSRAAGVAAAAAAADGALLDAAGRWRAIAAVHGDARAHGRAGLAAALAGDVAAATRDLAAATGALPDPAPRGLAALLHGVHGVVTALHGDLDGATRRLAGLAAATVPADPLAVEGWDGLAITLTAAGGDTRAARAAAARHAVPPSPRHLLLGAWLDLCTGHLAAARDRLAHAPPVLRRDAVLAAAVSAGLARRSGDDPAAQRCWHRVAPVLAGADVEVLLLDVWGELSAVAARVSRSDRDALVDAMDAAVRRSGSPWWAVAAGEWWRVVRAVPAGDRAAATGAAQVLGALAADHAAVRPAADAAGAWVSVLAGSVQVPDVARVAARLADAGRRWDAAALCTAAAAVTDPAGARALLGTGRRLQLRPAHPAAAAGATGIGLSAREREVGALVVDGLTHKEIGRRLYISPKTVEQHVARLRQKLAASNRASLVARIREQL
jgi:DNA-binding CsgD family transcriptional regulator